MLPPTKKNAAAEAAAFLPSKQNYLEPYEHSDLDLPGGENEVAVSAGIGSKRGVDVQAGCGCAASLQSTRSVRNRATGRNAVAGAVYARGVEVAEQVKYFAHQFHLDFFLDGNGLGEA